MSGLVKFERTARKAGRTIAITIPPEVRRAVGMEEGDLVELFVTSDRKIVLEVKRR